MAEIWTEYHAKRKDAIGRDLSAGHAALLLDRAQPAPTFLFPVGRSFLGDEVQRRCTAEADTFFLSASSSGRGTLYSPTSKTSSVREKPLSL